MTDKLDETRLTGRSQFIRYALLAVGLFLLTVMVLIGGLAWLLHLAAIGLSVDTRYLVATVIVCTMVLSVTAILLGAVVAHVCGGLGERDNDADREFVQEEIGKSIVGMIRQDEVNDAFVRNQRAEQSTHKSRRPLAKSARNKKLR